LYPQDSGESPSQQLMKQLADPRPYDLHQHDLTEYKALKPEWHQWASVTERCRDIGVALMDSLAA
jgi:hypothetical protein